MRFIGIILSRFKKFVLISVGLICLTLGIIGYVMPGLPGTIFLIIAATLFVRSSDRLYSFVVNNRMFGHQVSEFLETGAMRLKAKFISLGSMWIFSIISIFLTPYSLIFKVSILLLAIAGTIYIVSRGTIKN